MIKIGSLGLTSHPGLRGPVGGMAARRRDEERREQGLRSGSSKSGLRCLYPFSTYRENVQARGGDGGGVNAGDGEKPLDSREGHTLSLAWDAQHGNILIKIGSLAVDIHIMVDVYKKGRLPWSRWL
jgi:hypothetical protein